MLQSIDSNISKNDANQIFKRIDKNQEHKIRLKDFKQIFLEYDFSDINNQAETLISELKEIIQNNSLSVDKIF
jgi:hypothetical protein